MDNYGEKGGKGGRGLKGHTISGTFEGEPYFMEE